MIGLGLGFLNFLICLPGWMVLVVTVYGFVTTPKGESRIVHVLKTYAKVCSATIEAAWAAQRMLPVKRPGMGFAGLPLAAGGVFSLMGKNLPWLRMGLAVATIAFCAIAVLTYGQSRFDAGQAKIKDEWETATIKAMKAAAATQADLNENVGKIEQARGAKVAKGKLILAESRDAIQAARDDHEAYLSACASIRRLRLNANLSADDIPTNSG